MELYYSFSILIVLAAVFSYINVCFLKFPSSVGIMSIAMAMSIILVIVGNLTAEPLNGLALIFSNFDFTEIMMGAMLNFLLFAGAIHINVADIREQRLPILVFSTLGVLISTLVVGFGLYYILSYFLPLIGINIYIPLIYCFIFGALISPTDPIAVLSILKQANISKSLETKIAGESLLNDGVAVVIFAVLVNIAKESVSIDNPNFDLSFSYVFLLFLREALGGILLGIILGYIGSYAIRTAKDYKVAVLITLAIVMGGYLIAKSVHTSAPLAMVSAGLIIGETKRRKNKIQQKKGNVETFWELIDDVMNAILFLFMGFEILFIGNLQKYWLVGLICILVVLFARYVSIRIPTLFMSGCFSRGSIAVLVWGGLRGGVSIALSLSIPESEYKSIIIASTYVVVVFSIFIQGMTVGKLVKKIS